MARKNGSKSNEVAKVETKEKTGKRSPKQAKVEVPQPITTHSGGGKFSDKRPGVLACFNNAVMARRTSEQAITKEEVLTEVKAIVGERANMTTTLQMWLPSGVRQYHGIFVKSCKREDGKTGYFYDQACERLTKEEQSRRRKEKQAKKDARQKAKEDARQKAKEAKE